MIKNGHKVKAIVAQISDSDKREIEAFIQGAVYSFNKECEERWFGVKDLFGGINTLWIGTPLQKLYDWHEKNRKEDAHEMAGKDLGYLLLSVINNDRREFETKNEHVRQYKWIK